MIQHLDTYQAEIDYRSDRIRKDVGRNSRRAGSRSYAGPPRPPAPAADARRAARMSIDTAPADKRCRRHN